ncbi:MAG: ATP-binding cassette domain-containing protein [Anaerolineae bacterium]
MLLLDEPTNHLNFATMRWLEEYLRGYRGAMLVVSHDREFLNHVATAIVEIDEQTRGRRSAIPATTTAITAPSSTSAKSGFVTMRSSRRKSRSCGSPSSRRRTATRTIAPTATTTSSSSTPRRRPTPAPSPSVSIAEEKLKRIEADPIPQPPDELRFEADFDPQALKGRMPLIVSRLSKRYGDKTVLDDVSFTVGLHSRIVFVGVNGAGKSTLLRILAGDERADGGEVYVNPAVRIGYLDQEGRTLDQRLRVFEAYSRGLDASEQALKSMLLRSGLFRYDDLDKRVGVLSVRAAAQAANRPADGPDGSNLLMLDEPTNYVSFDVLEELEAALRLFPVR